MVHPASGAIVMMTTVAASSPAHFDRRPAPGGVDPRTHWWDGWSFAPRVDAPIAATVSGDAISITCPADAWLCLPDGSIARDRVTPLPVGQRARITMVGRYRGEAWIEQASGSAA